MEIKTIQKYQHTTPRKLRLVADLVRKMKPATALIQLQFTNKAATEPLSKAIKTVLANAKQQNLSEEMLVFKSIEVNEGPKLRRSNFAGRGRVRPFKKRMSHVRIIVTDEVSEDRNTRKSENQKKEAINGKKS